MVVRYKAQQWHSLVKHCCVKQGQGEVMFCTVAVMQHTAKFSFAMAQYDYALWLLDKRTKVVYTKDVAAFHPSCVQP